MLSCSFFGHSEISITDDLKDRLHAELVRLLRDGYDTFYFGGFGDFDHLCWQTVTDLKNDYPQIYRVYCLSDPRHVRLSKRPKWLKDTDYEEFTYLNLGFDYWYSRIYYRNCEMINQSDFVIFYANNVENSGAYKAYKHALKTKKDCINLAVSETASE